MEITDIRDRGEAPEGGWLHRPVLDTRSLEETVSAVLAAVRKEGDAALRRYSLQFDKVAPEVFELGKAEIADGAAQVDEALKAAIRKAADHIHAFHLQQQRPEPSVETMTGVRCWRKPVAIEKV